MYHSVEKVAEFYDAYSEQQKKVAYNERHYFLIKKVNECGLASASSVLDIGCGIGVMTSLIAKKVKHGDIVGLDLSPRTIEIAKQLNPSKNLRFIASSITGFSIDRPKKFDFILLFDVLEHIPLDQHDDVFRVVSSFAHDHTQVLINIPNAPAHEHSIRNFPEAQQIIEEVVHMHELIPKLERNGLFVYEMITYDMWQNDEYQFYRVMKKKPYKFRTLQPKGNSRWDRLKRKFFS